jgi:hypothetical protein
VSRTKAELSAVLSTMRVEPHFDAHYIANYFGNHCLRITGQYVAYHQMEKVLNKLRRFRRYAKQYQRRSAR